VRIFGYAGAHAGQTAPETKPKTRIWLATAFSGAILAVTAAGVFAGLNATATGTEAASSGTLSLTLGAASGSAGFGQTISNMAPGDVNNVYVELTNGGTIAGTGLTLGVTGTGSTLLTTSAPKGLAVAINGCSVAWTVSTGVCSGTTTALLASDPVATLTTTPGTIVSGAVAVGAVYHLQVSLSLPTETETTTNGTPPGGTIQGLSTSLTYTFTESQRTATTTNS